MKKSYIKLLIFIIIALLIEVFFFNFGYFRTLFQKEESTTVQHSVDKSQGNDIIFLNNINSRVTSIKINYKLEDNTSLIENPTNFSQAITYTPYFKLDGYSTYTMLNSKTIGPNKSCTFLLDTTTKATNIAIVTSTNNLPEIENVVINEAIFNFSFIRFSLLLILFICIDIAKSKNILKYKYSFNDKILNNKTIIADLTIISLFAIIIIIYINTQYSFAPAETTLINNPADITIAEPAYSSDALLNNNGKLNIIPNEELNNLENPYDFGIRNNIEYLYDVSYYNNNYYSYFGIAPIITCVIPLKLITSFYFTSIIYTSIFIVATLFIGFIVYKELLQKYTNKNIPTVLFYLGYFAIIFGSNFLTLLRGFKYDLPIASGIFYILLSIYLVLTLNKKPALKCVLLGFSTSLIVLSKPSFIVYYPLLILLSWPQIKELYLNDKSKRKSKTEKFNWPFVRYIIYTAIPIIILASFQMYYNYIRFGSIFEFGAKYQLTSYNMNILMNFSFSKIIYGLSTYIFTLPLLNITQFPFITAQKEIVLSGLNELTYSTRLIGLISIPIIYILLFKKNILQISKTKLDKKISNEFSPNNHLNTIINTILILSIILIIINTCMGGVGENYITDLKFIICTFSMILWFKLLENKNSKLLIKVFAIMCIITILIYIPLSLSGESNLLQNQNLSLTQYLTHTFEFWK